MESLRKSSVPYVSLTNLQFRDPSYEAWPAVLHTGIKLELNESRLNRRPAKRRSETTISSRLHWLAMKGTRNPVFVQ